MNKRTTIFTLFLALFLVGYLYATNKMVIYNHSNSIINKITVDSEFKHKELVSIKPDAIMKFTFFSPFDKKVRVKIEQQNQIKTITFSLQGFFLGEQYNQVEIKADGSVQHGALGLE